MPPQSGTSTLSRSISRRVQDDGWLTKIGRAGYAAKGVVYLLVGGLALAAALGLGGSIGGSKNAITQLGQEPFGQVALTLIAIGLLCYTIWRAIQAFTGVPDADDDKQQIAKRITYVVSGLSHAALMVFAASIVIGAGSGQSGSGSGAADWTAKLMGQPFGRWLVGIAGVIVFGFGLRQFYRAYEASFLKKYRRGEMDAQEVRAAKRIGQAGLAARGVVFCMIGTFVVQAALRANPSEAKGLGGALSTLLEQPYGRWLLGIVALGVAAYGLFCFSYVRWRDFGRTV